MRLIFVVAIALGTAALHAQQQSAEAGFVAVGCVARPVHDGSLAGSPGVPPALPNAAPVLANSSEPTNAFVLNGATTPSSGEQGGQESATAKPRTFVLDGANGLDAHVGHRVEVTGKLVRAYGGAKAGDKQPVDHIQVTALKMVAATCDAK